MMMGETKVFDPLELKNLYKPKKDSNGEDNGSVAIIGGSELFHGAPLLALTSASRIVDMVFFASPDPSVGKVAEEMKSKLMSFIWVPWEDVEDYVEKSDAVLIGPGFMRFQSERTPHHNRIHVCDETCQKTKEITKRLLTKFPDKRWVIDAGSLQVMEPEWIPPQAILTPNRHEFEMLFGSRQVAGSKQNIFNNSNNNVQLVKDVAEKYNCVIVLKGPVTYVSDGEEAVEIHGGNPGMTKGGTGDTLAGVTAALYAKNNPLLAACAASYITKKAGDELYKKVGVNFNADDLANRIPHISNHYNKG